MPKCGCGKKAEEVAKKTQAKMATKSAAAKDSKSQTNKPVKA